MTTKKALEELDSMAAQFVGHEKTNVFAKIAEVMRALEKYALTTEPDVAGDYALNRTERGRRIYGACREIRPLIRSVSDKRENDAEGTEKDGSHILCACENPGPHSKPGAGGKFCAVCGKDIK